MENKSNLALPIAIVVAGLLVAGAMFYTNKGATKTEQPTQQKATEDFNIAPVTDEDSIVGSTDAEIVIVEYSDTECPACKYFHGIMQKIVDTYGKDNKVAWVYRYLPLDSLHKKARKEAVAIECAKQQGGNDVFWKYINEVFAQTKSNDSLPETALPKIASDLKLDMTKWTKCYSGDETAQIVAEQEKTGIEAGTRGTPNSYLIFKTALSDKQIANLVTIFSKYEAGIIRISDDGKVVNLAAGLPFELMSLVIDNALLAK
jgi:protein-disulfide isomerase